MNTNPLAASLEQFNHLLQNDLFPRIQPSTGLLDDRSHLFLAACAMIPFRQFLPIRHLGRRPADRLALAHAFLAKAIFNLPTTRLLISFLSSNHPVRQLCGWASPGQLPHESTFSRAFAQLANSNFPELAHQALIKNTVSSRLFGHVSRDSTAVPARERIPEPPRNASTETSSKPSGSSSSGNSRKTPSRKSRKGAKRHFARRKHRPEDNAGTRIEHQLLTRDPKVMLQGVPTQCALAAKRGSNGYEVTWRGYKLHLDVADGQIPISAVITSGNVHDSQVAIPLMEITSSRIQYCYDLMDSAYDAKAIHQASRDRNHVPIVDPRTLPKSTSQLPSRQIIHDKLQRQFAPAEVIRYRERSTVERCFARLKDEFGFRQLRVRGAAKVMAHLMFGVLALAVDQILKLAP